MKNHSEYIRIENIVSTNIELIYVSNNEKFMAKNEIIRKKFQRYKLNDQNTQEIPFYDINCDDPYINNSDSSDEDTIHVKKKLNNVKIITVSSIILLGSFFTRKYISENK